MPTSKQLAYGSLFAVVAGLAFSISLFNIAVTTFIALSLISFARKREWGIFAHPFFMFVALFLAMNAVSLFQTDYGMASARGVVKVLKNIFLCLSIVLVVDSEDKLKKIFQWILIVACVIGVDGLIQGWTGMEILRGRDMTAFHGDTSRVTGPFRHANDFAAYLSLVTLLFVGVLAKGRKYFSWKSLAFFAAAFVVLGYCLIGTYSRGAWAAVGISVVLYALFTRSKLLFTALLTVSLCGIFMAPPLVKDRALSLFDPKNGTIRERRELWAESGRMIRESPWLGHGVNTYAKNEPYYKKPGLRLDNQYAHNGYLQIAAEIGLLGLVSFFALLLCFMFSATRAFVKGPQGFVKMAGLALVFGTLSFLIHSATDTNLQSTLLVNTLWMAMGIAWSARRFAVTDRSVQRILFARTDRMGDLLMNLPAIRLLRQEYPKAWITLLADQTVADLMKGHPDLDEVMTIDASSFKRSFRARFTLARRLRQARFDLAVVSNPDKWLHLATFLGDIPERIGWSHKWPFFLSKTRPEQKQKAGRHQMDWNLDLIKLVSEKKWDGKLSFSVSESARSRVEDLLKASCPEESRVVAIHPGTSNPAKRWAPERFAELCRRLAAEGKRIVLIGGSEENEIADSIEAGSASIVNWVGRLRLDELAAFLGNSRVRLLISADSGPVHIAWIQKTPVVALYARNEPGSDPSRWGPRDPVSEVIFRPIGELSVEEVHEAVAKVFQKTREFAPC